MKRKLHLAQSIFAVAGVAAGILSLLTQNPLPLFIGFGLVIFSEFLGSLKRKL
jgi:hypothetical protein